MNKKYWSGRITQLEPYVPGEQPKDRRYIKINTNENPYPPSPEVLRILSQMEGGQLRLYPDADCSSLRAAVAEFYGISHRQVFIGNGSDEILAFAFMAFFEPGEELLAPNISYSFYPVYANLLGNRLKTVPLRDDFTMPVDEFCGNTNSVVFANPNAPTSIAIERAEVERIAASNPEHLVLVDEAYVDFGGETAVPLIGRYPNLLICQTFSKSRCLAGARVGFAIGDESLISALETVKNSINSYTLDRVSLACAEAAMRDRTYFEETCKKVVATRERTAAALRDMGFTVMPSRANFLFAGTPEVPSKWLFTELKKRGILVRYFEKPIIEDYLRITVGTDEEMDALLVQTAQLIKEYKR